MNKKLDLNINKLYYLLGIFSGLYTLRFYNVSLVFFPLFMILILNILFVRKCKYNSMLFYYFFIIISLFVSLDYSYSLFLNNLKSFEIIKVLIFMYISIFIVIKKENILFFFKGVKITIIINLIWGLLEYFLYYTYGIWWNELIFGTILKIDTGGHGWHYIRGNTIGLCGFSWDPLHLGILSALGFFLFNNKYLKILSLIVLVLGGSRSGQIGVFASIFSYKLLKIFIKKLKKKELIGQILKNMFLLLICFFGIFLFFTFKVKDHKGDLRRKSYYISAVKSTIINNKWDLFLFGGSPIWSGAILVLNDELKKESFLEEGMIKQIYWKVESDWAHILLGRGWIGLLSYMFLFFVSILKIRDKKLQQIILLYFFAGIGYYFENSLFINILLIYINQNYKLKVKGEKENERNDSCWRKWDKTLSYNKSNIETNNSNI